MSGSHREILARRSAEPWESFQGSARRNSLSCCWKKQFQQRTDIQQQRKKSFFFQNMSATPATATAPEAIIFPSTESRKHPTKMMHALEWHGTKDVRYVERHAPIVTDSSDVIIRVTASTICGSDLHLYHNEFLGMEKGDVLGHEFVGTCSHSVLKAVIFSFVFDISTQIEGYFVEYCIFNVF